MPTLPASHEPLYTLVGDSHNNSQLQSAGRQPVGLRKYVQSGCYFFLILILAMSAFFAGRYSAQDSQTSSAIGSLLSAQVTDIFDAPGALSIPFIYNRTFSLAPSDVTDAAWESIFPLHGGLYHDPSSSDDVVVSVFHQLHCLDGLRKGYYTSIDHTEDKVEPSVPGKMDMADPGHIRHCFDYLRQSLMCNADVNFEPIDPEIRGTRGFGSNHICRDYNQILQFLDNLDRLS